MDLNNPSVEDVCIAWRKGLRRSYDLPRCTHSLFVPAICGLLPLKYELACRQTRFIDHHHHHLFGTLNMVHEVQLVDYNMTEQLNSDPRTLKSLFSL